VSSTTGSFVSMASLLDNPILSGTDNVVKPVDNSLARQYLFYVKNTFVGGIEEYFGPYKLEVCRMAQGSNVNP